MELIYSPQVKILKDANYKPITNSANSNVIAVLSMAAPRHPPTTHDGKHYKHASDLALMKDKVRMVLQTANYHGLDTLVLGAFGCGVFANPASEVAAIFKHALDTEFKGSFKHVMFAVLENERQTQLNKEFKVVFA